MKRWWTWLSVFAVVIGLGFVAGCSDDDDNGPTGTTPTETELEVLVDYMETNGLDLPTMLSSWIVSAQAVFDAGLDSYFIIDIRAADDFDAGHIEGAHNVALANVVTYEAANNTGDKPVLVVCYTGQSAGHAVMALRLMGADAQVLKFGMSGWHSDFDRWTANCADAANDYSGAWTTDDPPTLPSFTETTTLSTGQSEGGAILSARVNAMLSGGFKGIGGTAVLADPDDYHVINYWAETDWDTYGHIDGAYQVTPGTLTLETLDLLDPDETNVIYCWTGQTASMITAWLTVLGYDAKDLTFGVNSMIYSDLDASHKWDVSTVPDLDYETTGGGDSEFSILTTYLEENDMDLPDLLSGWTITAQTIFDAGMENYFIMDIRASDDYAAGHIEGAHNCTLAEVVDYEAANNTGDDPVVVVCYTGQSAGHAVMALRLSGVSDAAVLLFGMSSWHSDFDRWSANTGDTWLDYPSGWSTDAPPALPNFQTFPTLATGAATGSAILEARVDAMLAGGFKGVGGTDVLASPSSYHVINYWAETDWNTYGHISGAYQVTPGTLGVSTLSYLDPSETNVIYCWTGQTASMVTAWLTVVGYDAADLRFGVNSMIYSELASHKWDSSTVPDFEYVVETL